MTLTGLFALALVAAPTPARATTTFDFFQTYLSQLATFEELRKGAEQEVKGNSTDSMMGCILSGTNMISRCRVQPQ